MNVMTKVSPIAVYDEFRAQLAELREHNAKLLFDYEDPKGNEEARSHVYKLRRTKAAVDKARQAEKAASLEYGRLVDSEAKEIIGEIETMIEVHAKPLAEIENREKARVAGHAGRIEELRGYAVAGAGENTSQLRARIALAKSYDVDTFEEFAGEAARVKDETLRALDGHFAVAEKREAEAAELERLRAEAAERARQEREEAIRREAAEKAAGEAERKATAEREAAERRELELRLAAERAEREKVEAEQRAANAAAETERRIKKEAAEAAAAEAAETAKREADKKHRGAINRAAVTALVRGGLAEDAAKLAVTLIAQKAVPNVSILY